jgi:hypothetical protein
MLRTLLLTSALTLLLPFIRPVRPQESGWISTCAGVGCWGRRSACFIYQTPTSSRWCYWD